MEGRCSKRACRRQYAQRSDVQTIQDFKDWLRDESCWWDCNLVELRYSPDKGWGLHSKLAIPEGQTLFKAPRSACYGAQRSEDNEPEKPHGDSQMTLAASLLHHYCGDAGKWRRKLAMLPESVACPWTWSREMQQLLDGTELAAVLRVKTERLSAEYSGLDLPGSSLDEYAAACAVVSSHENPWFGGCFCPFNDMLNWGLQSNVSCAVFGPLSRCFAGGV